MTDLSLMPIIQIKNRIFRGLPAHLGELWNKFDNFNFELNPMRGRLLYLGLIVTHQMRHKLEIHKLRLNVIKETIGFKMVKELRFYHK